MAHPRFSSGSTFQNGGGPGWGQSRVSEVRGFLHGMGVMGDAFPLYLQLWSPGSCQTAVI